MVVMSKEKFDYFINGEKDKYEVIIGLEVHAQVLSNSKLFSGSSTNIHAGSSMFISSMMVSILIHVDELP